MCPACLTTAALVVAGAASAGGLTALGVKKLRAKTSDPTTENKGDQDESSNSCVTR